MVFLIFLKLLPCLQLRLGERENKTQRAEPDGKNILKKVEGVVITNVKISEKGPSHDTLNKIKHWQDLPAQRKILREKRGRERRP